MRTRHFGCSSRAEGHEQLPSSLWHVLLSQLASYCPGIPLRSTQGHLRDCLRCGVLDHLTDLP
jgi:hypothetical protein